MPTINQEKTQDRSNGSGSLLAQANKISTAMINHSSRRGSCNTPQFSENVGAGLDWISATGQLSPLALRELMSDVATHWGMSPDEFFTPTDGSYRGRRYNAGVKSVNGIDVLWRPVQDPELDFLDCRIEIKGTAIATLDIESELNLFLYLFKKWKLKATRCDFRADFHGFNGVELMYNVESSANAGQYMNYHQHSSYTKVTKSGECIGRTVYLGSTKSRCFTRWYDKGLESGTDDDWIRCETQTRESAAVNHVQALLLMIDSSSDESVKSYERTCGELALMGSEFRQRSSNDSNHLTRTEIPYIQWYKTLLDLFGQLVGYIKRTQPKSKQIINAINWIEKQCAQTLAALVEVCDLHWLLELLEKNQRNYSDSTKSRLAYWRMELQDPFPT